MIVFESKNAFITWEEEIELITHTWKKAPLTQEEYKDEHLPLIEKVKLFKPKLFISDSTDSDFAIVPETQIWMAQLISKEFKEHSNIQKIGIIPNKEFISALSSEQHVEEIMEARQTSQAENNTETQFFTSIAEAKIWIIK